MSDEGGCSEMLAVIILKNKIHISVLYTIVLIATGCIKTETSIPTNCFESFTVNDTIKFGGNVKVRYSTGDFSTEELEYTSLTTVCKLLGDTLLLEFHPNYRGRIWFTRAPFELMLTGGNTWAFGGKSSCSYDRIYRCISNSVCINTPNWEVDKLLGVNLDAKLVYQDSIREYVDTMHVYGGMIVAIDDRTMTTNKKEAYSYFQQVLDMEPSRRDTIVELNMNWAGLSEIPDEILLLENLEYLDLSNSKIPATDFDKLKSLKKLRYLAIESGNLCEIPSFIFESKNLEWLSLGDNNIGVLSAGFHQLSRLHYLNLSYNNLTKINEGLFNLSSIQELNLMGNDIPLNDLDSFDDIDVKM